MKVYYRTEEAATRKKIGEAATPQDAIAWIDLLNESDGVYVDWLGDTVPVMGQFIHKDGAVAYEVVALTESGDD